MIYQTPEQIKQREKQAYRLRLLLWAYTQIEDVENARQCFEEWAAVVKGEE